VLDLVLSLFRESRACAERMPALPVLVAMFEAIEGLYRAEDIDPIEVNWDVIATDVAGAAEFRAMMVRRRRWATDFAQMNGAFRRIVLTAMGDFIRALPECCFSEWDPERGDTFDVPLIDLLEAPVAVVDRLFMLPYDNDSFRLDLFAKLRELCASNMLVGIFRRLNRDDSDPETQVPCRDHACPPDAQPAYAPAALFDARQYINEVRGRSLRKGRAFSCRRAPHDAYFYRRHEASWHAV
jgi:hypothetical protein